MFQISIQWRDACAQNEVRALTSNSSIEFQISDTQPYFWLSQWNQTES